MIRHVVLMRLAVPVRADDPRVRHAIAVEQRLGEKIPDAVSWRFGPSVTTREVCADFAGIGDFANLDALGRFLAHPAHQHAAGLWRELATWTVADLEMV